MFLVISFDFSATSDVKIHHVGIDKPFAMTTYQQVVAASKTHRDKSRRLVECWDVSERYTNLDGHTLFWPRSNDPRLTLVATTNQP